MTLLPHFHLMLWIRRPIRIWDQELILALSFHASKHKHTLNSSDNNHIIIYLHLLATPSSFPQKKSKQQNKNTFTDNFLPKCVWMIYFYCLLVHTVSVRYTISSFRCQIKYKSVPFRAIACVDNPINHAKEHIQLFEPCRRRKNHGCKNGLSASGTCNYCKISGMQLIRTIRCCSYSWIKNESFRWVLPTFSMVLKLLFSFGQFNYIANIS